MSQIAPTSTPHQGPLELDQRARSWLDALDATVRPNQLAAQYPRIANRVALLWTEPTMLRPYLDELMTDVRGGRAGFPQEVVVELGTLRHYYDKVLHPTTTDVWHKIWSHIH